MRFFFAALLLLSSLEAKSLLVMTEELRPYNYTKYDKLTGMSTELVKAVMSNLDIESTIRVYPWSRALAMLQTRNNAVLFSMAKTPQREKKYRFACPLKKAEVFLFYKKGALDAPPVKKQLHRYTIGVVQDFGAHQRLKENGHTRFDFSSSTKTKVQNCCLTESI